MPRICGCASDTNTRKGYIHSIIDAIEVDDKAIRIVSSKDILRAAIAGNQTENGNVRGFVRNGTPRPMRMGTTPSRFPNDAAARDALQLASSAMLCHLALRIVDPRCCDRCCGVVRLPLNSDSLDQRGAVIVSAIV
jgi:hypothetical protein